MTPRTFDREMLDALLTILEAYSPEDARAIEAAYEARVSTDEEIAEQLIECLAENGEDIDNLRWGT
jgi:hypothetical protein